MAIVYPGGTIVSATFTGDSRNAIVENIRTQLLNAGWTDVSGASGDRILQSALTPQNLQCRVRVYDPGGGSNCARVSFRNVVGTKIGTDHFLFPEVTKTFRIIANKYQFFVLVPTTIANGREFCAGGVPFLESFLNGIITECFWGQGTGGNDTDTGAGMTFRTNTMSLDGNKTLAHLVNGNLWNIIGQSGGSQGTQRLVVERADDGGDGGTDGRMWHNGELFKYGARIAWGLAGVNDSPDVRGQLWGAVLIDQGYTPDVTATFDGHNWFSITGNNFGGCGQASLWVITT